MIPISTQRIQRTEDQNLRNLSPRPISNRDYIHFMWFETYKASFRPKYNNEFYVNPDFIKFWMYNPLTQCSDWGWLVDVCQIIASKYFIKQIIVKNENQ